MHLRHRHHPAHHTLTPSPPPAPPGIPTIPEKDRKLLVASPTACAGLLKRVAAAVDQPDVLAKGNLPVEAAMQLLLRFFHRSLSLKDLKQARLHELVTALPVSVSIKQAKKLAKARRQRPAGAAGAGAGVQQPHPLIGYLAQVRGGLLPYTLCSQAALLAACALWPQQVTPRHAVTRAAAQWPC